MKENLWTDQEASTLQAAAVISRQWRHLLRKRGKCNSAVVTRGTATHQVVGGIRMQPCNLDEASFAPKVQVQVLGNGGAGDSVGQVRADEKLIVQIQQLHVQRHGLFSLQGE